MILTLAAVAICAALAQPVEAQFKVGAQGALQTQLDETSALDGTKGAGVRLMIDPPLFPLALVASGLYYFVDCVECTYMTYDIAAQLRLPLPIVAPYVLGGWQWRRTGAAGNVSTATGPMAGLGVQVNFALSLFVEATVEFNDELTGLPDFDNTPVVIKGGLLIG